MRKSMFVLALGAMLALGATSVTRAQDNPQPQSGQGQWGHGRGMNPDRQLVRLTRELNLTDDQQSQIKPLLVDRAQRMQALFQDQSLSQDDRRAQSKAIRDDADAKILAVLNDDQKQKYAAMQQRMHRRGGEGQPQESSPQLQ
jgi:periplasmic protein CpxP/Spy